jgi:rhodanese-related sulfurtransferase
VPTPLEVTPTELKQQWEAGERPLIIDVREQDEWDIVNLSAYDARLIPLSQIARRMDEIPKDQDVVMQCRSGGRSAQAQRLLQKAGYTRVRNLTGGILGWADEVDPSFPKY